MKIAVVGGGIFGVTAAIELARRANKVDLFEQNDNILTAASGINQYRLHRGYHYPRSPQTASSCIATELSFRSAYSDAIIDNFEHTYCIAKNGSKTSANQFVAFCKELGLEYVPTQNKLVHGDAIELSIKAKEAVVDIEKLRSICWDNLRGSGVNVSLNTKVTEEQLAGYEYLVVSTYSNLNEFLSDFPEAQTDYQFELCEKPVVRLPAEFNGQSIVIMDGPFMCLDPFGSTGLFVLGNVVHAIHHTNIGRLPVFPEKYKPLINKGVIEAPLITKFDSFVSSAAKFFPDFNAVEHIGSMFTIRTVLPFKERTDERPTIINPIGDRIVTIFSGKIGVSVEAAKQVAKLVSEKA